MKDIEDFRLLFCPCQSNIDVGIYDIDSKKSIFLFSLTIRRLY